jgi:hypothetical protein
VGVSEKKIKEKTLELEKVQVEAYPKKRQKKKDLKVELNLLLEQDDLKWKQMTKVNWLRSEDKNTKFYHTCVNQRRHKNNIENILDGRGRLCITQ